MKKVSILTLLALFAATLTQQGGVWAQDKAEDWGQIATATSAWTHITAGSTTGFELADDYYYVSENLTFSNTMGNAFDAPGRYSGLYVREGKTVYLYIPAGVTLTAIGADANGSIGAGAGILLPQGSTLHIVGGGTLVARGGNAANGQDGSRGTDGHLDEESVDTWFLGKKIYCGAGGDGGHGGGGAGAGIGTAGGNGGAGGIMTAAPKESYADWEGGDLPGVTGVNGNAGQAADEMGTLYIQSTITQQITGGAKGNGGAAGEWGTVSTTGGEIEFEGFEVVNGIPIPTFDITDMQAVAGGGGGGGGAGGGSANAIGTGGSGGGGGASGAHGSACAHNSWVNDNWPSVGAGGGAGGVGTESNNGTDGATCWFQGDDNIFDDMDNHKPGGTGGAAGIASVDKADEVAAATAPQYTVNYYTVGVTPSKPSENYNVGSSTTITLPTLSGDVGNKTYKWILSIYGHAAGNTTSHCAGPNGDVYSPGDQVDLSNIYGAIEFCAVYVGCEIDCASTTNEWWKTTWANIAAGQWAVVNLKNRTLYKDGYWNTLTLPFSLSASKLATTCLAGADIREFKEALWDATNQKLTINFSDSNEGEIKAGHPYIVRWGTPTTATGEVIQNPSFTNVTVSIMDQEYLDDNYAYNNYETESNGVRFQGQIGPVQLQPNSAESKSLVLGAENKIYKVTNQMWVCATRAYFDYISNDDIAFASEIVLDFGNGEEMTTKIDDVKVDDTIGNRRILDLDGIFNLNGQRLDAPQKGINIINGKKVIIQ
jgi:hypothetical protein